MNRARDLPRSSPRTSGATGPRGRPTPAVLALQRSMGNRALSHLIADTRSTVRGHALQRFAEREHKLIGDTAWGSAEEWVLGKNVKMSFGDAVALGDYYESFDRMKEIAGISGIHAGTQGELRYALEVDIRGGSEDAGMGKRWDKGAVWHHEQLDSLFDHRNIGHFPNPVEGDLKRSRKELDTRRDSGGGPLGGGATYRKWHQEALRKAVDAARTHDMTLWHEALLTDGFACHFLTDAYSASHITTPRQSIKDYWDPMVKDFDKRLINWLTGVIDHANWHFYERGGSYPVKGQSIRGEAHEQLTHKIGGTGFGDFVSLVVHDVNGAHGVDATVGGKDVHLVGDGGILDDQGRARPGGAATFRAATDAVKTSIAEVQDAYIKADAYGTDVKAFEATATSGDGLYAAERLIPLPKHASALRWKFATVDDFLYDPDIDQALVIWGQVRGPDFEKKLTGFHPKAIAAVKKALVEPLVSGDEDQIRVVLREILDTHP